MARRRASAAASRCGGKKKKRAAHVSMAAASPEALKAALESQGSEAGMVESPIDQAAMAVGKKKRSKKKMSAAPIPPAPTPAPPEVSELAMAGRNKGRRRRRRRRPGQTPLPATAAPPKGKVGSGGSPGGKGKKRPTQGRNRNRNRNRNRGTATVCGGPNTKRSSGKLKLFINKRKAKVSSGIVGYLLVLQWPGGVEKSGKPLKTEFSSNELQRLYLHGLWPLQNGQDDTNESISKRSNDYLQSEDLSSKDREYLDDYFPSIICGFSNIKFWGVEWLHHGRAAESIWKSLDATNYKARYLMESVSIFLKYRQKIENALHGLQAKMKDPEAHDIVDEIHLKIGHLVKIQAVEHDGCRYLYQIHLSLDTSLLLQDYYTGSMSAKRLYANCKACDQINIPFSKSEFESGMRMDMSMCQPWTCPIENLL